MKHKSNKNKKYGLSKNNKGFSLIELILAVVILALIVTPILNSLVSSAKTSTRSQRIGEATDAATNIIEVLNSESVNSFKAFCGEGGSSSVHFDNLLSVNKNDILADEGNSDDSNVNKVYYINNIKSGTSNYDAKLTVTRGEAGDSKTGQFFELNDEEITSYIDPDNTFAQPYTDDANPDCIKYIDDHNKSATFEQFYLKSSTREYINVQRTITIDIDESNSKVYMYITYNYLFTYWKNEITGQKGYVIVSRKYAVLPGGESKHDDGQAVTAYVMYYPFYQVNSSLNEEVRGQNDEFTGQTTLKDANGVPVVFGGRTDRIVINNRKDVNVKLYLVKQRPLTKVIVGNKTEYRNGEEIQYEKDSSGEYIYKKMKLNGSDSDEEAVFGYAISTEIDQLDSSKKIRKVRKNVTVTDLETNYDVSINEMRSETYNGGWNHQFYTNAAFNIAKKPTDPGYKIVDNYYHIISNPLLADHKSDSIDGSLINTEKMDRIYYIKIEMYEKGSFDDGQIKEGSKCIYEMVGSALR